MVRDARQFDRDPCATTEIGKGHQKFPKGSEPMTPVSERLVPQEVKKYRRRRKDLNFRNKLVYGDLTSARYQSNELRNVQ